MMHVHLKSSVRVAVLILTPLVGLACSSDTSSQQATARGTVQNITASLSALNADTKCGFSSDAVKNAPVIQGNVGQAGQVQWKVSACKLSFADNSVISSDCGGTTTFAKGGVTFSGTKTVTGTITGDPSNPVIPDGADSTTYDLTGQFDNFSSTVSTLNAPSTLTWQSGGTHFTAQPRYAASADVGTCSIPTPVLSLPSIAYQNQSKLHVETVNGSKTEKQDYTVDSSSFSAQVGGGANGENFVEGNISVDGKSSNVGNIALDPSYSAPDFQKSYSCAKNLQVPVNFTCASGQSLSAQGAARGAVAVVGAIAQYIDLDSACGFSSPTITANPQISGSLGETGGKATYNMPACTLRFPTTTALSTDCNGTPINVQGIITVSGTKTVTGIYTGNPAMPIIPTDWAPETLHLNIAVSGLTYSDSADRTITFKTGTFTSDVSARTAQDTQSGMCTIKTPVSHFTNLNVQQADEIITQGGVTSEVKIDSSTLEAQVGQGDTLNNYLAGSMTLVTGNTNQNVTLPQGATADALDPAFDPGLFIASYSCIPHLSIPAAQSECSMAKPLGEQVARLLVQDAIAAEHLAISDKDCGFDQNYKFDLSAPNTWKANDVLSNPTNHVGNDGQLGSVTWSITQGCELVQNKVSVVGQDCNGLATYVSGSAKLQGTLTVSGTRYTANHSFWSWILGGDFPDVHPLGYNTASLNATNIALDDYSVYKLSNSQTVPDGKLTIHSGSIQTQVVPLFAQNTVPDAGYNVETPIVSLPTLTLKNAKVTLVTGGNTFNFDNVNANLQALNGSFGGLSNYVSGQIDINGNTASFTNLVLDPSFAQDSFDASYACVPGLAAPIPAQ